MQGSDNEKAMLDKKILSISSTINAQEGRLQDGCDDLKRLGYEVQDMGKVLEEYSMKVDGSLAIINQVVEDQNKICPFPTFEEFITTVNDLRREMMKTENKMETAEEKLNQATVFKSKNLSWSIQREESKIVRLSEELKTITTSKNDLDAKLYEAKEDVNNQEKSMANLLEEKQQLEGQVKSCKDSIVISTKESRELSACVEALEGKVIAMQHMIQAECKDMTASNKKCTDKYGAEVKESERINKETETAKSRSRGLQKEINVHTKTLNAIEKELQQLEDIDLPEVKRAVSDLQASIQCTKVRRRCMIYGIRECEI